MKIIKVVFVAGLISGFTTAFGQILHTESFAVILDSTRTIKGSIVPDFKIQNLKENLIEFENTADITFKLNKSAITLANKIELSQFGNQVLLSGSFLYIEYRKILEYKFVFEPYSQIHWADARGLNFKYAGGIKMRYRLYYSQNIGFFGGIGPFYEYEEWNYDGVDDNLIPANPATVINENLKIGSYLSFKWRTSLHIDIDLSVYHQSTFSEIFTTPRLASSSSIKYNFTEHLGLIIQYQNIYDYQPVVPIDKLYNLFVSSIEVSF